MSKHRSLIAGGTIPQSFLDALQEVIGTYVSGNFVLSKVSDTQMRVVAGSGNDQVGLAIMGKYRYTAASVTATHPGGAAGVHDVYVTASDNAFTGSGVSEVDVTTYAFGLEIRTSGTPATDLYRKVGTVVWNGAKITGFTQTVGPTSLADGSVTTPKLASDVAVVPVGGVLDWPWASGSIPSWALLPYGQSLPASGYPAMQALAEASGLPYGGAAGSSFNLPDMRGVVSAGKDDMGGTAASRLTAAISGNGAVLGALFGGEGVVLTTASIPAHNHPLTGSPGLTGAIDASGTGIGVNAAVSGVTTAGRSNGHVHSSALGASTNAGLRQFDAGSAPGDKFSHNAVIKPGAGGTAFGYITDGESADHNHSIIEPSGGAGHAHGITDTGHSHTHSLAATTNTLSVGNSTGGGGTHLNVQPTIVVNKLMRVV